MADEEEHQRQGEDEPVDQRRGQRVEVVVRGRDELAHLVDEQPGAGAREDRHDRRHPGGAEHETEQRRDHQGEAAPEHVGDVQLTAADLRIAGGLEEPARPHHRDDEGHDDEQQRALRAVADPGARARCIEPWPSGAVTSGHRGPIRGQLGAWVVGS